MRPYLHGAEFVIYTDREPLRSMFTNNFQNTKMQRWAVLLAEYCVKIECHKGSQNIRVGMMSNINPTETPKVAVIDCDSWVDPHAFPDQTFHETMPLEHDGLDLSVIRQDQTTGFVSERRLALDDESDYALINDALCSLKHPTSTPPAQPRLMLSKKHKQ